MRKNENVVAYVRLPHTKSYYSGGNAGVNVNDFPRNIPGVYRDALVELSNVGFDFTPYADPATHEVTHTFVIFAGKSNRSTSDPNDLMPTAYRLEYYFLSGFSIGAFAFNNFTFCPEQNPDGTISAMGVCVHEFGHAMGLTDMYDISGATSGAGYFDVMSYGLYADFSAQRPAHFGAYSKEQLGWITPEVVTPQSTVSKLLPPIESSPSAIKIPLNSDEYYLIENRQFSGFDQSMSERSLCSGTYIWHIDTKIVDDHLFTNTVNLVSSSGGGAHIGIRVLEADGRNDLASTPIQYGECTDAWENGRLFSSAALPFPRSWDGTAVPMAMQIVAASNQAVTLHFSTNSQGSSGRLTLSARRRILSGKLSLSSGSARNKTIRLYLQKNRKNREVHP